MPMATPLVFGSPETLQKTVVWIANRDDPPPQQDDRLVLTSDGKLILQTTAPQPKSIAEAAQSALWASMLDTGNFVIFNSRGNVLWQSFDFPTDTLLPGQSLVVEGELFSSIFVTNHSTGRFYIRMQSDGNLVQYPTGDERTSTSYYASNTCCRQDNLTTLNFTEDGSLRCQYNDSVQQWVSVLQQRNSLLPMDYRYRRDLPVVCFESE
uniref:Bulb-type lectin domain-containing protein n=1 Tax=Nelumbo nucifera TaxID=4432 RepID=A0A822Y7U8_NELNU|nr:TPA_asm: hypothetical protein HUJ06_031573 [Nelumbo nucifera]